MFETQIPFYKALSLDVQLPKRTARTSFFPFFISAGIIDGWDIRRFHTKMYEFWWSIMGKAVLHN